MPWLMKEVKKEMGNMIESRELLMGKMLISIKLKQGKLTLRKTDLPSDIIKEILESRAETYRRLGEDYDASREQIEPGEDQGEGGESRDVDFTDYEPPVLKDTNLA